MEAITQSYFSIVQGECIDLNLDRSSLKSKNTSDLLRIQEIMIAMDGKTHTLEQVLERVIGFYRKLIPFTSYL